MRLRERLARGTEKFCLTFLTDKKGSRLLSETGYDPSYGERRLKRSDPARLETPPLGPRKLNPPEKFRRVSGQVDADPVKGLEGLSRQPLPA